MDYLVCQIAGRQYMVSPGQTIEVNKLKAVKTLEVDTVMLRKNGDKILFGKPFLKEKANFEILGTVKKDKIRVARFHAKANYRRVTGSRAQMTQIKLLEGSIIKSTKKGISE